MIKSWFTSLKRNPFLCFLIIFIFFVWLTNIKQGFYLLGWDNYSSYFNLKTNIFRTIFSTWRSYRGLGVASDSEITDLARQIFFSFFNLFLNKNLLDQVYYLFSFSIGLLGMYKLSSYIFHLYDKEKKYIHLNDLFSFLATFFYVFNLNTLSTFYFPIVMFVTRFYALPVLFYLFLRLINSHTVRLRQYFLYLTLFFLASGSFMVPTVFIATCVALGIFVIFQKKLFKAIGLFGIFLCLSTYWFLPFINYTIQKSAVVRLTPTFIDGNEGFINKNKSYYEARKQMIFYPQFFDMKFTDSKNGVQQYFHPLADLMNAHPNNFMVLQIFPLLYVLGSIFMLVKAKHKREWLWVPGILFVFLFLSMKEYSILGFVYAFLSKQVPIFAVIFRFADTKFHPYAVFTGSIAASFGCLYLYEIFHKVVNKRVIIALFLLIFVSPTLFLFQEYFKGNLIGFFMYNKIPQAYQEIADVINKDPEDVRVVHLPIDQANYYWKPYSWGLYSSAFLNYMLDKPLFDKTFEPASKENTYVDQKMNSLQENIQSVTNDADLSKRASDFALLMQKVGVKYIIADETISDRINSRGIDVWGTFSPVSSAKLITKALELGLLKEVKKIDVDINDYKDAYVHLYPYKQSYFEDIKDKNGILPITLYEVVSYDKKISFLTQTQAIDNSAPDMIEFADSHSSTSMVQNNFIKEASIYPFLHTDNKILFSQDALNIAVPSKQTLNGTYSVYLDGVENIPIKTYLIEVAVKKDEKNLTFSLYHRYLPTINNQNFVYKIKEITLPLTQLQTGSGRGMVDIRINDTVLQTPSDIGLKEKTLGAVVVKNFSFTAEVIQQYTTKNVDMNSFTYIPNSDCYKDAFAGYTYSLKKEKNEVNITSTNGSVCLWNSLKNIFDKKTTHAEFEFDVQGVSEDKDKEFGYLGQSDSTKPILKKIVAALSKPQHLKICIKEAAYDDCYNTHDIQVGDQKHIVLPAEKKLDNMFEPTLFLGLRGIAYEKQLTTLKNLTVNLFETKLHQDIAIPSFDPKGKVVFAQSQEVTISAPLSRSSFSYYYKPGQDSFYFYNTPCQYYRTIRTDKDRIISYVEQCDNTFFVDLPFSNNNFYLWEVEYNLGAGQYPYFIMEDKYRQYVNERISLNQGYPDIAGFKNLQGPEFFASKDGIKNTLDALLPLQAYTYIYPYPDVIDTKNKSFFIKQFTENEGLFTLNDFHIVELPNTWSKLVLEPENDQKSYVQPISYKYESILPSLWKVIVPAHESVSLLKFNEGFDTQWGLYGSLQEVFFGKEKVLHYKCDGYANCFELSPQNEDKTYYIFYWPERLAAIGWFITLGAVAFGVILCKRSKKAAAA